MPAARATGCRQPRTSYWPTPPFPCLPGIAGSLIASVGPVHAVHQICDLSSKVRGQVAVPGGRGRRARQQHGRRVAGAPRRQEGQQAPQQRLDAALLRPQRERAAEKAVHAAGEGLRPRLRSCTQAGGPRKDAWYSSSAAPTPLRSQRGWQQRVQLSHGQPGCAGLGWLLLAAVCHCGILDKLCQCLKQVFRGRLIGSAPAASQASQPASQPVSQSVRAAEK